jgi:hypothetical protein
MLGRGPHTLSRVCSRLPEAYARASLRLPAAAQAWRSGSSRQGCASYEVQVLCRQLPEADGKHIRGMGKPCTMSSADGATTAALRYCTAALGATWGGEQPCGPEHARMTAASQRVPDGRRCTDMVERRPGPHGGQAAVVGEETGPCPSRAAGGGGQARRAGGAETTSGRSASPQGLTATCIDPRSEARPEAERGGRTGA